MLLILEHPHNLLVALRRLPLICNVVVLHVVSYMWKRDRRTCYDLASVSLLNHTVLVSDSVRGKTLFLVQAQRHLAYLSHCSATTSNQLEVVAEQ